ncbi:hypothetical protein [Vibrio harveyi]|uniref:hypothetical protein n=1 Tax=Vibrio harveyi TaxID=669 RepID=UPI003CF14C32
MRRDSLIALLNQCQTVIDVATERGSLNSEEHASVLGRLSLCMKNIEAQIPSQNDAALLAVVIDEKFEEHHALLRNKPLGGDFDYEAFIQEVYIEVNGSSPSIEQASSIKHQLIGDFNPKVSLYHQCRNLCVTNSDELLSGLLSL